MAVNQSICGSTNTNSAGLTHKKCSLCNQTLNGRQYNLKDAHLFRFRFCTAGPIYKRMQPSRGPARGRSSSAAVMNAIIHEN